MKKTYRNLACIMTSLALQSTTMAVELHCPASIFVTQTVSNVPATWVANDSMRAHQLDGAGFTAGPPKELGYLRPEITVQGKFETHTYLVNLVNAPAVEQYWLDCNYGGTAVTVGQPIHAALKQCRVTYEIVRKNDTALQSIQCK